MISLPVTDCIIFSERGNELCLCSELSISNDAPVVGIAIVVGPVCILVLMMHVLQLDPCLLCIEDPGELKGV